MKLLLSISLLFSFSIFADNHDSDDSQWNVAEYYVSAFKDGKDMDDMMKWAEKWNAWANETDEFHYIQLQIATSLWFMSLTNWKRQPSPKQAKSAIKMIEKAEDAEII